MSQTSIEIHGLNGVLDMLEVAAARKSSPSAAAR